MAYLAKGNKPDLLSVCEEMGVEVDQSSKVVDIKKLILNSESYVEEEVKIILDRVISDKKERERSKQEEREREDRMQLKDLLITEQLKYRVPAEVREHFLDDRIKLITPYELAEKLDEYESIKQSFRREIPKKNSYKFQGGVNYSGARPKETPKDFKSKFQIKKEPVHEKNHEKDFEKRRQLRCYECGSYSHLRPQCDKLKKNYETVASNETVRNGNDVLAPYTTLGTVNGIEMPILRDTGATLDLICKKYVKIFHVYK
ncbi:SCAN box domain-containing protein [Trichonephila clavipes]|nr:SCAN box domain-containing protein [Trichonephila clavipes]